MRHSHVGADLGPSGGLQYPKKLAKSNFSQRMRRGTRRIRHNGGFSNLQQFLGAVQPSELRCAHIKKNGGEFWGIISIPLCLDLCYIEHSPMDTTL